jgi:hypothetical protein
MFPKFMHPEAVRNLKDRGVKDIIFIRDNYSYGCYILTQDPSFGPPAAFGYSECSKLDRRVFCKETGKRQALERAIESFKYGGEEKTKIYGSDKKADWRKVVLRTDNPEIDEEILEKLKKWYSGN